ncbi:MAG TPA: S41 family peptidase [Bryobacteraceae bacterium]|nr:S41 family peptidase [Bryobacteraceae bacterium]HOL72268.1 S41 family peptidase [Bryobacteraceae bacterium]HOQ46067.1 S41 family peptidase [Bryobacteraceae bacterium]HPQ16571.1 S41 family peptidase [Bryobacteraceae bacterium]HPU72822.1 S41 family peptidase [Bryobacteraceae bacterium]
MAYRRSALLLPAVIAACSVLGGVFGPSLTSSASAASSEDDIKASVNGFTKVYALVEKHYADPLPPDKAIYKGAIPGMLRTLDPHSSFFDPREFQLLREDQRGHYYGVGMTIGPSRKGNGRTICISPFPGSPAAKAGIRPGDEILAVNDKPTDNLSMTEIADMLKGPRGTTVKVSIGRDGHDTPLIFTLTRDEIPRKSVHEAFWLKPGIAYVDIAAFSETTSRELEENLKKLGEENIKGLVLDLRDNPGGLLNEGVAVASRFLRKGQLVVSHRGRASAEKPYTARTGNGNYDYPIVVLVNRYSASAAEIVAGALQDHDRAWILGENTFGKGLVQTVFNLAENTGLALTTARYYTPSGRLIQRDYSNISFYDYYFRKDGQKNNPLDAKSTDSGRTVYGGNGITPDEKFEEPKLDRFQATVRRRYVIFNFVAHYLGNRQTKLPNGWEPDTAIMEELHKFMLDKNIRFTEAEFAQHQDWLKRELKREMYTSAFGLDEARRLTIETDPEVARAIEAMPKARALLETAKRVVAQRVGKQ